MFYPYLCNYSLYLFSDEEVNRKYAEGKIYFYVCT